MKTILISISILLLLVACEQVSDVPPQEGDDIAKAQSKLATNPTQAELWSEAANSEAVRNIGDATIEGDVVRQLQPLEIPDVRVESRLVEFPEEVEAAVAILNLPELDGPFSGKAMVRSVEGQILQIDIDQRQTLTVQAKVPGGSLRFQPGEVVELHLSVGTPFQRDDVLVIRSEKEVLIYSLVGDAKTVEFRIPNTSLRVAQTRESEANMVPVQISDGEESHILMQGEQNSFRSSQLTVKVLGSLSVRGPSANALPGHPNRVELIGWHIDRR